MCRPSRLVDAPRGVIAGRGSLINNVVSAASWILSAVGNRLLPLACLVLTPTLAAATQAIPLAAGQSLTEAYVRFLVGLALVIGIMLILYAFLKKRFSLLRNRDDSRIHILEIKPVAPRKSLCLIEVGGEKFLLGLSQDSINLLGTFGRRNSPASGQPNDQPASQSFDSILKTNQTSLTDRAVGSQMASQTVSHTAEQP